LPISSLGRHPSPTFSQKEISKKVATPLPGRRGKPTGLPHHFGNFFLRKHLERLKKYCSRLGARIFGFWRGFGEGAGLNNPVIEPKRSQKPKRPLSPFSSPNGYSISLTALNSRVRLGPQCNNFNTSPKFFRRLAQNATRVGAQKNKIR
jgi:hypothetical protein